MIWRTPFGIGSRPLASEVYQNREYADGQVLFQDVRKVLRKDLATSIGHKENGAYAQTQKVVVGQSGFPELVQDTRLASVSRVFRWNRQPC